MDLPREAIRPKAFNCFFEGAPYQISLGNLKPLLIFQGGGPDPLSPHVDLPMTEHFR